MVMKDRLVKTEKAKKTYFMRKILNYSLVVICFLTIVGIPTYLLLR